MCVQPYVMSSVYSFKSVTECKNGKLLSVEEWYLEFDPSPQSSVFWVKI